MRLVPGIIWTLLLCTVKFHSSFLSPGIFAEVRCLVNDYLETGFWLMPFPPRGMNTEDGEAINYHCNCACVRVHVPLCTCVHGGGVWMQICMELLPHVCIGMCMFLCERVYVPVCMHKDAHVYMHTYASGCAFTYAWVPVCMCTCERLQMCMCVHICACVCATKPAHMCMHGHAYIWACTWVCACETRKEELFWGRDEK